MVIISSDRPKNRVSVQSKEITIKIRNRRQREGWEAVDRKKSLFPRRLFVLSGAA